MVIVYQTPVSLTSVFKPCCSPDLEKADFGRQRFQYTWLNGYFFNSLQEMIQTRHTQLLGTTWQLRYSKKFVTTTWPKASSTQSRQIPVFGIELLVSLLDQFPPSPREAVTSGLDCRIYHVFSHIGCSGFMHLLCSIVGHDISNLPSHSYSSTHIGLDLLGSISWSDMFALIFLKLFSRYFSYLYGSVLTFK